MTGRFSQSDQVTTIIKGLKKKNVIEIEWYVDPVFDRKDDFKYQLHTRILSKTLPLLIIKHTSKQRVVSSMSGLWNQYQEWQAFAKSKPISPTSTGGVFIHLSPQKMICKCFQENLLDKCNHTKIIEVANQRIEELSFSKELKELSKAKKHEALKLAINKQSRRLSK